MATKIVSELDARERRRVAELMTHAHAVFVFGSNLKGVHGAGAARVAAERYGARHGVAFGPTGRAYAIPTKRHYAEDGMPLAEIAKHVNAFLVYARAHPWTLFAVTRIGCGFAGYGDDDVAPLFADAPEHCELPEGWRAIATPLSQPGGR